MSLKEKETNKTLGQKEDQDKKEEQAIAPAIVEEIIVEELAVDGICGIY